MDRSIATFLFFLVAAGCSNGTSPNGKNALMSKFEPGQVWQFNARSSEAQSRLTVLKTEAHPKLGNIVHIRIDGIALKNPNSSSRVSTFISHLPYGEEALSKCVTNLERSDAEVPAFEEGYKHWKQAFDAGRAGIWTAPVSDAIASMESALNQ
jgi:hypothetical protein